MDADGDMREHADIVEITGLLPKEMTEKWPTGMRVIVRREHPHPGAQLSLFEHADGGATKRSRPTPPPASWRSSKPATAPTPASKTASGTRKTPAWDGSPPANTASTPPGFSPSASRPT